MFQIYSRIIPKEDRDSKSALDDEEEDAYADLADPEQPPLAGSSSSSESSPAGGKVRKNSKGSHQYDNVSVSFKASTSSNDDDSPGHRAHPPLTKDRSLKEASRYHPPPSMGRSQFEEEEYKQKSGSLPRGWKTLVKQVPLGGADSVFMEEAENEARDTADVTPAAAGGALRVQKPVAAVRIPSAVPGDAWSGIVAEFRQKSVDEERIAERDEDSAC